MRMILAFIYSGLDIVYSSRDTGYTAPKILLILVQQPGPTGNSRLILSLNKMADACFCAKLDNSPELEKAMQGFIDTTPTGSINFTDFYALKDYIILSPVEIK